jgi:hypothetical protein
MLYVFLKKIPPEYNNLELNDVGIIHKESTSNYKTIFFLRLNQEVNLNSLFFESFDIKSTGDKQSHKVCDRCFKRLPTSEHFQNNRHKKDNHITKRPSCRACRKVKEGVNISSADKTSWKSKRPPDFSPFQCPICNKTTIAGISKIVLDHNHNTGKVRGYLCESCNTGIGRFDDNAEIIRRAISWLNEDTSRL